MPAPFSLRLAFIWTLLVTSGLWLGLAAVFLVSRRAAENIVVLGSVQIAVYALVLATFGVAQRTPPSDLLALRKTSLGVCLAALAAGFLLQVPATLLADLVEHLYPTAPSVFAERVARITPHSRAHAVAIGLVVVALGPCVEEFFFRGALFGALRRGHGRALTALTVAVCFSFGHLDLKLFLPLFVSALAIGEVRELTGSIWPGLLLHAAFNGATLLLIFSGAAPQGAPPQMPFATALSGCVGTALMLGLVRRLALSSPVAQNARSRDQRHPS